MSSSNNHRDRSRRKDSRFDDDYDSNRRDRNKERHQHERNKSDKPRRRERSRSRHRDDDERYNKKPREENRRYNDRSRGDNDHSKKFNFTDRKIKDEPSPEWGKSNDKNSTKDKPIQDKAKPDFGLSGKLTEDANTVNGVVIKYSEPQDARKPARRWRLYPFKGEKALPTLYVHRQSAYLMGRDRKIADIPLDHPSCSKQHAALQYRLVPFKRENGGEGKRVRPYLIDLDSANGTFVNNVKLEPRRYHELLERDVIKFGFSSREYVLLHEHSRDDELDDDVTIPNET